MSIFEIVERSSLPEGVCPLIESLSFVDSKNEDGIAINMNSKCIIPSDKLEEVSVEGMDGGRIKLLRIPYGYNELSINFNEGVDISLVKCVITNGNKSCAFGGTMLKSGISLSEDAIGSVSIQLLYDENKDFTFTFYRALPQKSLVPNKTHHQDTQTNEALNPYPIPMTDGPLFREAVSLYEQFASLLLKKFHSRIEKLSSVSHTSKNTEHKSQMRETFKEFRKGFSVTPKPESLVSKYESAKAVTGNCYAYQFLVQIYRKDNESSVGRSSLRNLQNFLSCKRGFDDESKKYYEWLSKLLGSGKSKDLKLFMRMSSFEASKLRYFNYLYDTVTGCLLEMLKVDERIASEYLRCKAARLQLAQKIESVGMMKDLLEFQKNVSSFNVQKEALFLKDPTSPYKLTSQCPSKTGLLFVHGGQGKSGWHKQWVVLLDGKLYEYMDWRRGSGLRNNPIDIALCNIKLLESNETRMSVDIGHRKNCFRLINSQGIEHVFQAFTIEEATDWVKTLFDACQMIAFNDSNGKKKITGELSNNGNHDRSSKKIGKDKDNTASDAESSRAVKTSVGTSARSRMRRVSSVSQSLLYFVQGNDPSNYKCADCGTTEQVEWISLNLLVVFCIRCSSAHRSLGTSVSKVRSLILDSFNEESKVLIHQINNSSMNAIYESDMPPKVKPAAQSSDEVRYRFIKQKYAEKKYVNNFVRQNALPIMIEGIRNHNIRKVLEGIVGGADVNRRFYYTPQSKNTVSEPSSNSHHENDKPIDMSFLEYALLHPTVLDGRQIFDIAELLTLNGCNVGSQVKKGSLLSNSAKKWWQDRIDKINYIPLENQAKNTPLKAQQDSFEQRDPTIKRPSIMVNGSKKTANGSKSKIKNPKEGFSLFRKKTKSGLRSAD